LPCLPAFLQPEDITDDDARELRYYDVRDGCRWVLACIGGLTRRNCSRLQCLRWLQGLFCHFSDGHLQPALHSLHEVMLLQPLPLIW
jgi:hypothetical protein